MRLTESEFRGMNTGIRRFFQLRMELPVFRWLGSSGQDQDILEIGCGSGVRRRSYSRSFSQGAMLASI